MFSGPAIGPATGDQGWNVAMATETGSPPASKTTLLVGGFSRSDPTDGQSSGCCPPGAEDEPMVTSQWLSQPDRCVSEESVVSGKDDRVGRWKSVAARSHLRTVLSISPCPATHLLPAGYQALTIRAERNGADLPLMTAQDDGTRSRIGACEIPKTNRRITITRTKLKCVVWLWPTSCRWN